MLTKEIIFFGQPAVVACDERCNKAWGVNQRPKVELSKDPDDYASLADDELPEAPADPGTYEGGHGKPTRPGERMNKWCVRECERCVFLKPGEPILLPDYSRRRYNFHNRQEQADKEAAQKA
jgi:hypothetical protein